MESQWHQVVAEDKVIKDGLEKESETEKCKRRFRFSSQWWHSKSVLAPDSGNVVLKLPCREINGILKPILLISISVGMIRN